MKKYIFIIMVSLLAFFTACEDFLTVQSPDKLTSDTFWRNLSDAEEGIAAAYSQLEYSINTWSFAEVKWPVEAYREDIIAMGNDAMNYPNWVELSRFTYTNGNSQVSSYWANNYRGINFANQVIEKVPTIPEENIDPALRDQIINEAYFLRAYYHLKLILNWEEIIIRDIYITKQDQLNQPLSSRTVAWDFIIEDLKKATKLPATYNSTDVGRATKGAALSYLGFCYLTRAYEETNAKKEYLEQAVQAFNQVTGYELVKDFKTMFNATNKNSKESIFELQFSMNSASGANYYTQLHRWMGVSELWGWDEILPSEILMDAYMKEGEIALTGRYDSRLYHTIFFECDYFNDGNGRVYGKDYKDWFYKNVEQPNGTTEVVYYNRPAFQKFMPADYNALSENYCAINIPLMRYANVLLMQAEALNELGETDKAKSLINQVRDVHGDMPAMQGNTQADVRKQIEHERMIEFPLENWRWYDLRRWGKLEEAMKAANRNNFSLDKNSFYPIPLTEINANDAIN